MLFQDLSPHVHFLSDAAHLLSQSAPETSAFLMSRRNHLLVENDMPISDAQRQHVCSCCGHIMVPGAGDVLKIETEKALRSRTKRRPRHQAQEQKRTKRPGGISKVMTCGNCSQQTRLKLEGPSRVSRRKKAAQQETSASQEKKRAQASATGHEPVKVSANASSKKRAKNRKAGLQALLDQKQGSASATGNGLSLADFMKR